MFELVRAFVLRPHKLYKGGNLIKGMAFDLEYLQRSYQYTLEIAMLKGGGFLIYFPPNVDEEELYNATEFLTEHLGVSPRLVDLAQVT